MNIQSHNIVIDIYLIKKIHERAVGNVSCVVFFYHVVWSLIGLIYVYELHNQELLIQ